MLLPFGYRIIGILCVSFGFLGALYSILLASLISNGPVNGEGLLNGSLIVVFLWFCGGCSIVAGACLFRNTHAAWARARSALFSASLAYIALALLGIHSIFMLYRLLEAAENADRSYEKVMGRPLKMADSVQREIDLAKYSIAAPLLWAIVLSGAADRLSRHLPPKQEETGLSSEEAEMASAVRDR